MAILDAVFADRPGQTPQDVERRRRIAKELLAQAGGAEPIRSPWQGVAKIAQALVGGYEEAAADKQDASNRTAANKALIDAVYGGSSDAAPSFNSQVAATSPSASAPSSGGNSSYRDAIASIESKGSGDYGAVGPTNAKMGRALGRYQIMEANIGPWSREALGREVSAEEFMKNPQIQDAIFDHRFGQYVSKYGPEGAAQAWFAGPGGVGKTDRKDVLGTSVGDYGSKFVNALGPQAKPVEVASLGGASIDAPMAYYDDKGFRVENRPPVIQPDPLARPAGASVATVEANAPQNAAQAVNAMASPRTVGALPVPPNAQPMPQGIPAEFAGSQQLANAQGGIVPALMGGTAASPEQIAQARALGAAQPQPQPQGQDNRALIATLLGNPYTAEAGQQLLMQEMKSRQDMQNAAREEQLWRQRQDYEAQQRQADPAYKMGLEKNRLEIDTLRNPQGFRQLTPQEIAQRGLDPKKQYQIGKDDKVSQIGDSGTNVSVTMGGEPSDNNLRKKLDEKTGELWSTYQEQGATSAAAAQDFGVLDELIKVAPQGPIQGRLAEMFPGVSSAGDAFQSIVKRVAPTLRAPGSGATSDIEYDGMLKSLPALRNKPEANQAINAVMKAKAAINVERSSVIDQYGRGEITAGEARSKIAEIDKKSIMSPELKKALEGIGATSDSNSTPTVGEVIDGYRFKGGDPADQNSWERQ